MKADLSITPSKTTGWIGVDLDGTLAHYDGWVAPDSIGVPIEPMVKRVKAWIAGGLDVRIFTARGSVDAADRAIAYPAIQRWCLAHIGWTLPITNVKDIHMIALYDDRAIRVAHNVGHTIDEDCAFLSSIRAEVARARAKFPSCNHLLLAMAEESGEAVKAGLDIHQGKADMAQFRKELIQTAAMCARLYYEGDPSISIPGEHS